MSMNKKLLTLEKIMNRNYLNNNRSFNKNINNYKVKRKSNNCN